MRWIMMLLVGVLFTGCRAPKIRSEPIAPDTYKVIRRTEMGPAITREQAYNHAQAHAAQEGKHMVAVSEETSVEDNLRGQHTYHTFELIYRLVDADDPALQTAQAVEETSPAPLTGEDDLYTKLTKLKAMKDEGLLSDEEFQRVKAEVMSEDP